MKMTMDMKHSLTASILALAALMAPDAAVAARCPAPDVESVGDCAVTSGPSVRSVDGGLELSASNDNAQVFLIYSITGQLVKTVSVSAASHETVSLPGGCYVVRCQVWAKKIVVR